MKSYAIEIFFNNEFDEYVRGMWKRLYDNNISYFMEDIEGVVPHIALSVYNDVNSEKLKKDFSKYVEKDFRSFELYFDTIAMFKATGVIYTRANINTQIFNLFMDVKKAFKNYSRNESVFYSPERWNPHCTLGKLDGNEKIGEAFQFCYDNFEPKKVMVCEIALIEVAFEGDKCLVCRTLSSKKFL